MAKFPRNQENKRGTPRHRVVTAASVVPGETEHRENAEYESQV